jgi:hypothetical protein
MNRYVDGSHMMSRWRETVEGETLVVYKLKNKRLYVKRNNDKSTVFVLKTLITDDNGVKCIMVTPIALSDESFDLFSMAVSDFRNKEYASQVGETDERKSTES